MLNLTSTSDVIRVTTPVAVSTLEVHASYVDLSGDTVTAGRKNTRITTATTTTVVPSPPASTARNVRGMYITNNSTGTSVSLVIEHFDGTNAAELFQVILLPGENVGYREDGSWVHRDHNGAEYPPAGLGSYSGRSISFMKTGTAADTVGYWYSTYKDAGFPGAWTPGTPGVNGRVTDGTQAADYGCIPIPNPSVGANYLTEIQMAASANHSHFFYDVLWVNSTLFPSPGAQALSSPTLPPRDANGTSDGEGCVIGLYFTAAGGVAAVNSLSTVTYTNSKGVSGRVATQLAVQGSQVPATPVIGTVVWYNLQAGDTGVRSIQSFSVGATTWNSGTISLFIARDIATIGTTIPNVAAQKIIGSPGIRLYDGTCMHHAILASTVAATFFAGELVVMEK